MKLDGEQVFCHDSGGHKLNSNPFEYNDNALDASGLKSGNEIVKENQKAVLSDSEGKQGDADQLPYAMNGDNEMEVRDFVAPILSTHSSVQRKSFESLFYMDKNVMECEFPDIVCYKDNSYHVIKDICVDEGLPTQDKCLFYTGVDEKNEMVKQRLSLDAPTPDAVKYSAEEKVDSHLSGQGVLKPSEEKDSKNDFLVECDPKDLLPRAEVKDDSKVKITAVTSKKIFSLGDLLRMPELEAELCSSKSTNESMDKVEQKFLQRPSDKLVLAMASASEESEHTLQEAASARAFLVSAAEESNYDHEKAVLDNGQENAKLVSHDRDSISEESTDRISDKLSYNGNMETGTNTFDFDSARPTISGRAESSQNGDSKHLETHTLSRLDNANTDPAPSQLQYSLGETSFSAAGPLSGLITSSGRIACSGSVSLRSDSSTTSTRSFAFPVLQSEWNTSPVRMAKADRRKYKSCWTHGLLCCRF